MIIGVTGTNGAGKGTLPEYLAERHGFTHYSARAFIIEEIERRGLPVDRTSMNMVANDLRKTHGPECVVKALYERAQEKGGDAIIESVRALGEARFLKEHGAFVVAIDADRMVRYERITKRASETDRVSFEEFCMQEDREMAQEADYDMNVRGVMAMADYTLTNDGSIEELHTAIEEMVQVLREKEAHV
ncbi:MAG TPA: AAA family ATPase [Candidatus Paceibacterota bacterium]|nr:AAA family ATPase [Candidatus Paceibacterota bacterium]